MNLNRLFFLGLLTFILFGCTNSRYIYAPAPANNPFFNEKGESKLTTTYSESESSQYGYARGWDLQGAYALSNHWAVTASYFNRREMDKVYSYGSDNTEVKYKRNLFGVGGGYFVPLNPKKTITFNFYVGVDFGKFSFDEKAVSLNPNYDRYHTSNITKGYFQPSINFMPGKFFRFGIYMKSSYVHYGNIKTSYTPDELAYYSLDVLGDRTRNFIEFGYNMQFGLPKYQWIRLELGLTAVNWNPQYNILNNRAFDVRSSNVSIGINLDFTKMKKKGG